MAEYENLVRDTATGKIKRGGDPSDSVPLLEQGRNIQDGAAYFSNTKTVSVVFGAAFSKVPRVLLTPNDSAVAPHWKTDVTATGFVIRCKTKWTGLVEWQAQERNGD